MYTIPGSWKCTSSSMAHIPTRPMEHVWDALERHARQHEEEWDNIPQATINSIINSMRRRCVALHEANGDHTRYGLFFFYPRPYLFVKVSVTICDQLYSQSCEIHILGPNELISIDWFPNMNCNSVKSFEIVVCCVYNFCSVDTFPHKVGIILWNCENYDNAL